MIFFLLLALFTPLLGAASIGIFGGRSESIISRLTLVATSVYALAIVMLFVLWGLDGFGARNFELGTLYRNGSYNFDLVLFFDHIGAVFLGVTAYISTIIVRFSRYYMHREEGYHRFFITILVFIFGMSLLILSGTIDLLFAGWEIVGISSFLLIGFYRSRTQPVENALRVYTVYRVCDIGVLLGTWLSHMIWHKSQDFNALLRLAETGQLLQVNSNLLLIFSLLLLFAAVGKSAQFPFCYWLPRAMEGPTPSSAIFYGALSIHAGVFLLIRTYPVWHAFPISTWAVGIEGGLSVLFATLCGRVQSNIKGQIAYASITQVGIMLIELALGFPNLALMHFVGNAGLRCYQLLVSPSVVAHLLRVQGTPSTMLKISDWSFERLLPSRWRSTFYIIALNEGLLYFILNRYIAEPLFSLGKTLNQHQGNIGRILAVSIVPVLVWLRALFPEMANALAAVAAFLMLMASLSSLAEHRSAHRAWHAAGFSSVMMGIIVVIADGYVDTDVWVYLTGIVPGWVGGIAILSSLRSNKRVAFNLETFNGQIKDRPLASIFLFIAFLVLAAFPISPAFIGEDLLLQHAVGKYIWLAAVITIGFIINGISLARIYTKVCLGPSPDEIREVNGRSTPQAVFVEPGLSDSLTSHHACAKEK
ncbi:MAG: proton-conducting transporter membrane subunit [Oligoflexus sp.]